MYIYICTYSHTRKKRIVALLNHSITVEPATESQSLYTLLLFFYILSFTDLDQ